MSLQFGEYRIIISPYLVDHVHRSWRERLFSWPWRPWARTKEVPSGKMYQLANGTLIMSPRQFEILKGEQGR